LTCARAWLPQVLQNHSGVKNPQIGLCTSVSGAVELVMQSTIGESASSQRVFYCTRYRAIRLYDDEGGEVYRLRSICAEFVGNRQGGWALLCGKIPPTSPANETDSHNSHKTQHTGDKHCTSNYSKRHAAQPATLLKIHHTNPDQQSMRVTPFCSWKV
jgi:hypothetical protein